MADEQTEIPRIIDDLRRIFQIVAEHSREAEKVAGLTGPQLWALKLLESSAPQRVSDLARNMYLHPATVVGILNRLEAKGLLTRTRSTADRRVVQVELSVEGRRVVTDAPEVAQVKLVQGLAALTPAELASVTDGISRLVRILGAEHLAPQPLLSAEERGLPGRGKTGNRRHGT